MNLLEPYLANLAIPGDQICCYLTTGERAALRLTSKRCRNWVDRATCMIVRTLDDQVRYKLHACSIESPSKRINLSAATIDSCAQEVSESREVLLKIELLACQEGEELTTNQALVRVHKIYGATMIACFGSLVPRTTPGSDLISIDQIEEWTRSDAVQRCTKLEAGNKNLSFVPRCIGCFTHLTTLDLSGNGLPRLPQEIGELSQLTRLYLGNNQLATLPSSLGNLTELRWLLLASNQLTTLPAEIGNLSQLNWLILDNNQLTTLPAELRKLVLLKGLYLENNYLTGPHFLWLKNYMNLEELKGEYCQRDLPSQEVGIFLSGYHRWREWRKPSVRQLTSSSLLQSVSTFFQSSKAHVVHALSRIAPLWRR